jgi:hypothetical protein
MAAAARRPALGSLLLGLWALLTAACGSLPPPGGSQGVDGWLELGGPTFGEATLRPAACAAGERQLFLGADFHDPASKLVARLAIEPLDGPGVRIFDAEDPFGREVTVRRGDCEVFRFSHQRSGWKLNDIDVVRVALELRCELASGDTVRGELSASGCS